VSPKFNRIGSEAKGHFRLERYVGTKYTIDLMKIICDLDSAYERLMKNAFAQQDETAIEVFKGHHPSLPIELSIRFLPHQDPSKFTNRQRIYSRERYLAMWRIDIGPLKDRVAPTHLLWTCAENPCPPQICGFCDDLINTELNSPTSNLGNFVLVNILRHKGLGSLRDLSTITPQMQILRRQNLPKRMLYPIIDQLWKDLRANKNSALINDLKEKFPNASVFSFWALSDPQSPGDLILSWCKSNEFNRIGVEVGVHQDIAARMGYHIILNVCAPSSYL